MASVVWMFHVLTGGRTGVRGQLSIEKDRLRFRPDRGEPGAEIDVALEDIDAVSSPPGSPVLEVELATHALTKVLFYFFEPPFLFGRKAQFKSAAANALLRDEVDAWVRALRRAG